MAKPIDNAVFIQRDDVVSWPLAVDDVEAADQIMLQVAGANARNDWGPAGTTWEEAGAYRSTDCWYFREKLLPSVFHELKQQDCLCELLCSEDWPQFARTNETPEVRDAFESRLLASVQGQPWGQFVLDQQDATTLISIVADIYPDENILVVTHDNAQMKRVAEVIHERTGRHVSTGAAPDWRKRPLVHVESISGISRSSEDWGVLIFADYRAARSDTGMSLASSFNLSLIYACIAPDSRLDWEDRLRLRVACGPDLFRESDAPSGLTDVTVLLVPAASAKPVRTSNHWKNKLQNLWRNGPRNQQIARLAKALADPHSAKLQTALTASIAAQEALTTLPAEPTIAVLVELPIQARELAKYLPGWSVRAGTRQMDGELGINITVDRERNRLIVTRSAAMAAGAVFDIVLLADGTAEDWEDDFGPVWGVNEKMLIVDMQDGAIASYRPAAGRRIADYRRRGWSMIWVEI